MTTYQIEIQASNAEGDIWQTMHLDSIATDQDPADLAADVAANQNIAEGDGWRVRITEIDVLGDEIGPWIVNHHADGTVEHNPEHALREAVEAHEEATELGKAYQAATAKRAKAFQRAAALTSQSALALRLGISQPGISKIIERAKAAEQLAAYTQ